MTKPFDATAKHLLATYPDHWCRFLGLMETGQVSVVNSELSTVTTEADTVLRIEDPDPWLVQVEFQTGHDRTLPQRLQRYHILLSYRHGWPVQSAVILPRPEADGPGLTGVLEQRLPNGRLVHEFHFLVVRAWEKPVDEVLQGGVATLPLAPLADLTAEQLPGVIARMRQRIDHEVPPEESATLWTATYILMGLRYPADLTARVLQGVRNMRESVTYQAILAEGEARGEVKGRAEGLAEGERRSLMRQGRRRFGEPSPEVVAAIEAIVDVPRLEALTDRLFDVSSWDELLSGDESGHSQ